MKQSNYSFLEGFMGVMPPKTTQKTFDWDKAAEIIRENLKLYPDLTASAGLQGDWDYTGGTIFRDGKPYMDSYTYLSSGWAVPTLIIESDDEEILETPCYLEDSRFTADSKWDEISLKILNNEQ